MLDCKKSFSGARLQDSHASHIFALNVSDWRMFSSIETAESATWLGDGTEMHKEFGLGPALHCQHDSEEFLHSMLYK